MPMRFSLAQSPKLRRAVCAALSLSMFATGCADSQTAKEGRRATELFFQGNAQGAIQKLRPLAAKTDENFVLNNLRLGSAALSIYDLEEAEAAFLRAYEVLNSFGVNNGGRSLGAALVDEKIRIWRGEPYERAMANFYLGLVYYMQRDYNNARGAFENALFKLRDYADDKKDKKNDYTEQESNFAIASVMLGRCWQRLGREDMAADSFKRAGQMLKTSAPLYDPTVHAHSNVLLVVDFGYGPRKTTDFDGSIVGFAPTPQTAGQIPQPLVIVDGRGVNVNGVDLPTVDTVSMAADRHWQSIDTIRLTKSAIGTGLIAGGVGYGAYRVNRSGRVNGDDMAIAAGMIATGLLLKATSQADTRHWEMVPRTVFLLPLSLPPGTHDITVEFPNADGLRQTWTGLVAPDPRSGTPDATYYFRMQRWNSGPFVWPPATVAPVGPKT